MSQLTREERDILSQFKSITAQTNEESAVEALRQVGFNLEAAISRVYDGSSTSTPSTTTAYPPSQTQNATVDEALLPSSSSSGNRMRSSRSTNGLGTGVVGLYYLRQALSVPIAILSWPVSILYNVGTLLLGFLARLLGFRISTSSFHPRNPFTSTSNNLRPRRTILSPYGASEEWVRSVERLNGLEGSSDESITSTGSFVGSSTGGGISRRTTTTHDGGGEDVMLPNFFIGGYEDALRKARDELKVLMVVLSCREHDQDGKFKSEVLTNPELVKSLKDEQVIVWGGDIMERDAYQVGRTLAYTALPLIAFIALQPTPSNPRSTNPSNRNTSTPRLSLISRIEPTSSSTSPILTATEIHTHFHAQILPKTDSYLTRLRNDRERRERERYEREERERRLSEIERRDEEKILGIRKAMEVKRREEEKRRVKLEEERKRRDEMERDAKVSRKWRGQRRKEFEGQVEPDAKEEGVVRVVVRLGNGQRAMRRFDGKTGIDQVYQWVECELGREEDEEVEEGEEETIYIPNDYVQKFAFKLATTFPRTVLRLPQHLYIDRRKTSSSSSSRTSLETQSRSSNDFEADRIMTVEEVFEGMGKDVNVVVDGLEERRRMSMSSRGANDESDEDDSEEDSAEEDSWEDQ